MGNYVLQTIFRERPDDPLRVGSYFWPFVANSDEDAKIQATAMLTDWQTPNFVAIWETGTAARILMGDKEVSWRSFDQEGAYANWS